MPHTTAAEILSLYDHARFPGSGYKERERARLGTCRGWLGLGLGDSVENADGSLCVDAGEEGEERRSCWWCCAR